MNKKQPLTRTCLACGSEKPLAAFLQLSGTQGTVYGNICSTCRSSDAKNKNVHISPEVDERGSSSTGIRIDAKVKIKREIEDKLAAKKAKESHIEENKKLEKISSDKIEKVTTKEKGEKDHRTTYIEAKQKRSFLNYQQKTTPSTREKGIIAPQDFPIETDAIRKQELDQTTDFSSGVSIDPGIAGVRFQLGESQQRLEALLGKSAFMSRMKNTYGAKAENAKKTSTEKSPSLKDPLVDYVKDNLNPGKSRRGR